MSSDIVYTLVTLYLQQYLRNFGYISKNSSLVQSDTDMRKAISEFQSMAGIEQTGLISTTSINSIYIYIYIVHDCNYCWLN